MSLGNESSANRYLLVELKPQLRLGLVNSLSESLEVFGDTYADQGHGDFTGFYDWLRSSKGGGVIGLRYWPFEGTQFLLDAVASLEYVEVTRGSRPSFNVFFGSDRDVAADASVDQDFGGNRLFRASAGSFLLSFIADQLGKDDVERLMTLGGHD